jgi:hypothetical protein
MLPGAHPSPVILQLENLFFSFFAPFEMCFFVCLFGKCGRAREREISIKSFGWTNGVGPIEMQRVGWVFPLVSSDVY